MRWSSGSCVVPVAHDFERRYADRVAGRYTWCSGLIGSLLMSESVGRRRGVRVVACTILECSVRWRGTWNGKGADGGRGRGAGGTGERWACVHRDDNGGRRSCSVRLRDLFGLRGLRAGWHLLF